MASPGERRAFDEGSDRDVEVRRDCSRLFGIAPSQADSGQIVSEAKMAQDCTMSPWLLALIGSDWANTTEVTSDDPTALVP